MLPAVKLAGDQKALMLDRDVAVRHGAEHQPVVLMRFGDFLTVVVDLVDGV